MHPGCSALLLNGFDEGHLRTLTPSPPIKNPYNFLLALIYPSSLSPPPPPSCSGSSSSSSSSWFRMIRELLQHKKHSSSSSSSTTIGSVGDHHEDQVWKHQLSLGPSFESDGSLCRKRKKNGDQSFHAIQTNIELQLKDPLPPDWEQCLDLQSGRMYYLNRRTLRKSWEWPREHKLDLDLNISTLNSNENLNFRSRSSSSSTSRTQMDNNLINNINQINSSSSNMVAVPCLKCHLLVMLCTSSPSCPNCKYVHSLPALQRPPPTAQILSESRINGSKPVLETLSLLN